jgi:hypothetical protein
MQKLITSEFIRNIGSEVHPELKISESSIIYLEQSFDPYWNSVRTIRNPDKLLEWVDINLPGELGKHARSKVIKEWNGQKVRKINSGIGAIFEYLISESIELGGSKPYDVLLPWDIKNALSSDEEFVKMLGLEAGDNTTFPVTIIINGQNFVHELTEEQVAGLYAFKFHYNLDWGLYVLSDPIQFDVDYDEISLNKNVKYKELKYSVQIDNKTYIFERPDFIQGWVTGAMWAGIDPYAELSDFASLDENNVKTLLEII